MRRLLTALFVLTTLPAFCAAAAPSENGEPADAKAKQLTFAHIELKGDYPETPQVPGLFGELTESLSDAIERLRKAGGDKNVSGVVLRIKGPAVGWGKINDLRQEIKDLREKGKKVYALTDTASTKDYLLASACDEIIMPEPGVVMVLGLRAEVSFYKNLLDMLAVDADFLRVGEFKSAAEPFTRTSMSDPFRQEMQEILDDYYRQLVEAIAEDRGLEP
ncbi:MAG: S49 family peptidase, partial [Planctomycetes bacterium]|nr:S49 family peptidase [Planctomycetota bacterium]